MSFSAVGVETTADADGFDGVAVGEDEVNFGDNDDEQVDDESL